MAMKREIYKNHRDLMTELPNLRNRIVTISFRLEPSQRFMKVKIREQYKTFVKISFKEEENAGALRNALQGMQLIITLSEIMSE